MAEGGGRTFAARAYFALCRALGWALRSSTYSAVRIVDHDGELQVRKHRSFYAPLLIWMGEALLRILDTGVRVLPQREWEERERRIYQDVYGRSIRIDADGTLVLPRLAGKTLANVLDDPAVNDAVRTRSIELAVVALVEFHRRGLTHGDAMAENVLVDLESAVARWFDFETVHDSIRPLVWRRADDVRALLVTCLTRTVPGKRAETLERILDVYGDEDVTCVVATTFGTVMQRPLPFHLGQAGLSFDGYREIARLLTELVGEQRTSRVRRRSP